jgi:proteasome accessory factor C
VSAAVRVARLLALVPWLRAHPGVTMQECAEHFGITVKELEADLWLLVVSGKPGYYGGQLLDIQFWRDGSTDDDEPLVGPDCRIEVIDAQSLERPLRLTEQEASTLVVALRVLSQTPGLADRTAILSAAAKIEQAAGVRGSTVAVRPPADPAIVHAVDRGLLERRVLRLTYVSAADDSATEREVEPLEAVTVDGVPYLSAYCRSAGGLRTFRIDRIRSAVVLEEFPERRAEPGAEAARIPVTLALLPEARWIMDVHSARETGTDARGRTLVTLPAYTLAWAARLVLSLGGGAVAVDPPELVDAVAAAAQAALASYP